MSSSSDGDISDTNDCALAGYMNGYANCYANRRIELEPAVVLAYQTILHSKRINVCDTNQLAMQINNFGVEKSVTPSDVESMIIRFIKCYDYYTQCVESAQSLDSDPIVKPTKIDMT